MNLLKFSDPAPSKLSYKVNRLFYRLWFKLLILAIIAASMASLAKNIIYDKFDLNKELKHLSEESSALYKDLTELSVSQIVVTGANGQLKNEIIKLIQDTANAGFSKLKAKALREKIQKIKKVKKAFVRFATDGLVYVKVVEREEAVVFFNNNLYEVLDVEGVILSVSRDLHGLSSFPLIVGKSASQNIQNLLSLVREIGSTKSDVLYYEWIGERRWDIHMKDNIVFKLPENNLNKGLELMHIFLNNKNRLLKPMIAIDLRNVDKPIIKFWKSAPNRYMSEQIERWAS